MRSEPATARPPFVLCIHGSPRHGGNTDLLLDAFAEGVQGAGGRVEHLHCRYLNAKPCTGCEACQTTGTCVLSDDMGRVYRDLDRASALVIGTPVYFLGPPAPLKALIDRCQCRWHSSHGACRADSTRRPGALLSAAGAQTPAVFTCVQRTVGALFEAVGFELRAELLYGNIDGKGAIRDHPSALSEARSLGATCANWVRGEDPVAGNEEER